MYKFDRTYTFTRINPILTVRIELFFIQTNSANFFVILCSQVRSDTLLKFSILTGPFVRKLIIEGGLLSGFFTQTWILVNLFLIWDIWVNIYFLILWGRFFIHISIILSTGILDNVISLIGFRDCILNI